MKLLITLALLAGGCSNPLKDTPFTEYFGGPMITVLAERSIDPTHKTLGEHFFQISEEGPPTHPNLSKFRYIVLSKESLVVMVAARYRDPRPIIDYLDKSKGRTIKVRSVSGKTARAWADEGSGKIFVMDDEELKLLSPPLFNMMYGDA